jgi:undecaprenyl-diphosphatase
MPRLDAALARLQHWDEELCARFNRGTRHRPLLLAFRGVSWLGDGVFWYSLMLALLVADARGNALAVLHMAFVGAVCTATYKMVKRGTLRPRPFQVHGHIAAGAATLDTFSFPSGHTLHAVGFTLVAISYFPSLATLLVPFTLLTALSRVALGLHYPSDVLAGAALGAAIGAASFLLA